ncbi:MAG: hypothetical protein HQ557_12960 [Bacteroidetes bacterium]|nr:hypothetical protein [Bacteroidota bacterium]
MKKIDKILAAVIISILFIFSSFQLFVWCGSLFGLHINAMALTGLTVSVLFCLIWLRDILNNLYTLSWWYFIIFYLISSSLLFIHIKVFIIPLLIYALFAGLYTGRRIGFEYGTEIDLNKILTKAALFSEIVLVVYYLIGAIIFLTSVEAVNNIIIMHYTIEVTSSFLWIIMIIGGVLLLPLNYFLVLWSGRSVYSIKSEKNSR